VFGGGAPAHAPALRTFDVFCASDPTGTLPEELVLEPSRGFLRLHAAPSAGGDGGGEGACAGGSGAGGGGSSSSAPLLQRGIPPLLSWPWAQISGWAVCPQVTSTSTAAGDLMDLLSLSVSKGGSTAGAGSGATQEFRFETDDGDEIREALRRLSAQAGE
jgi:hypothetical protein